MFLPFRDEPNPPGTPFVNYALLAANILVFAVLMAPLMMQEPAPGGEEPFAEFVMRWGFRPAEGSVVTLFTSMFMHGGWAHLIGNMLFLWIYGDNVEARLGHAWYLVAYLATGALATLSFAVLDLSSDVPLVGASGAISGVLGFYFVFFPRNVVHVFVFFFPFIMNVVAIPARIVLGFYLVFSNIIPLFVEAAHGASGGGGIAYAAHIGGFVGGLGAAYALGARGADRVPEPTTVRRSGSVLNPANHTGLERAIRSLVAAGRVDEAAERYFQASKGSVELEPQDGLEIGRWLVENDNPQAALHVFQDLIRRYPRGETAAWAHLGAGYVQASFLGRPTAGYQHFLDVIDLDPNGEAAARARASIREIDGR